MILKFDYRCLRCQLVFEDSTLPDIEASSMEEVENIVQDSLRKNPTAKKRAALVLTHLCEDAWWGIAELIGYRMIQKTKDHESDQPDNKILKMVRRNAGS